MKLKVFSALIWFNLVIMLDNSKIYVTLDSTVNRSTYCVTQSVTKKKAHTVGGRRARYGKREINGKRMIKKNSENTQNAYFQLRKWP